MKRQPRLTKRERKEANPIRTAQQARGAQAQQGAEHIHCIACGRHLDPSEFSQPPVTATHIRCDHGSTFPACVGCAVAAETLVQNHDRSGQPVKIAKAWH